MISVFGWGCMRVGRRILGLVSMRACMVGRGRLRGGVWRSSLRGWRFFEGGEGCEGGWLFGCWVELGLGEGFYIQFAMLCYRG